MTEEDAKVIAASYLSTAVTYLDSALGTLADSETDLGYYDEQIMIARMGLTDLWTELTRRRPL